MQERYGFDPWVRKDPLEEGMATNSVILAWRLSWTEEPGRLQSIRLQRVRKRLKRFSMCLSSSQDSGVRLPKRFTKDLCLKLSVTRSVRRTLRRFLCALSRVWLFVTPWTVAHQASLSMEFPRQEYWRGLPFPSPGDRPTQGLNMGLWFLLHFQAGSLHCATWEAWLSLNLHLISYFLMFLVCRVPLENLQGRKTVVKEGASIPRLPN